MVHAEAKRSLSFLSSNRFLNWRQDKKEFETTKLGKATVVSALSPEESLVVYSHLTRARDNFCLSDSLHLVFQLTPVFPGIYVDWDYFEAIYNTLVKSQRQVGLC